MNSLQIDFRENSVLTALMENGKITELFVDPANTDGSWVGRIILGRIKTILPGQFAFIDIGAKKNAFINLQKGHGLKAGDAILVQADKDAHGTKGISVKQEISIKGRLAVLYKNLKHTPQSIGISRKITDENFIRRLKKYIRKALPTGFSAIIRTNAQDAALEEIEAEIIALHARHNEITDRAAYARPPATLHPQTAVVCKDLLTDLLSEGMTAVNIRAAAETFAATKQAVCEILPSLQDKIIWYNSAESPALVSVPQSALNKQVPLPCGGAITIEQTEACVVIDVNTASNAGNQNYRQTVLDTNTEAAVEIAAQLRLRNLSGIIIIDFIDMPAMEDKDAIQAVLEAETKKDRIKVELHGFSALGMMQLTRRRTRPTISEFCGYF